MGVPREVIDQYGVISEQTARAMAHTVREHLHADYGLGITGVAGPDKQEDKPVGTVHIAIEGPDGVVTGMGPSWRASREDTKRLSVLAALNLLRLHLEGVKRGE
jgi:nicotinamide-nucleotide amidase